MTLRMKVENSLNWTNRLNPIHKRNFLLLHCYRRTNHIDLTLFHNPHLFVCFLYCPNDKRAMKFIMAFSMIFTKVNVHLNKALFDRRHSTNGSKKKEQHNTQNGSRKYCWRSLSWKLFRWHSLKHSTFLLGHLENPKKSRSSSEKCKLRLVP